MNLLDKMFDQVGAMIEIPCTATGTNAISLTPQINCPALTAMNNMGGFRFVATATSSGAVTAQYNNLGFFPVYHADGATQANIGDILTGFEYVFRFFQALTGGLGGFLLETPATPVVTQPWGMPGGRLTLQSAIPVMLTNQPAAVTVWYAPYVHQFVPIFNGANIQPYQFTSSLLDQVGLALNLGSNWAANTNFDVFSTLVNGVAALCTIPWASNVTRATGLAIFGGFLTNAAPATARLTNTTTFTLGTGLGTFLGTFRTTAVAGQSQFIFGGSGAGGVAAFAQIANYYNQVLYQFQVNDNAAAYTYTSAVARAANNSTGNTINLLQCSAEKAILAWYNFGVTLVANGAQVFLGMSLDGSSLAENFFRYVNPTGGSNFNTNTPTISFAANGLHTLTANEASDGVNANVFNINSLNNLSCAVWL